MKKKILFWLALKQQKAAIYLGNRAIKNMQVVNPNILGSVTVLMLDTTLDNFSDFAKMATNGPFGIPKFPIVAQ